MKILNIILSKKDQILRYSVINAIAIYLFLCLLHFLSGRALWLDENFILNNLKALTPFQLFGSLGSQAFPRVYLILIQAFSRPFDYNVYALRLLPLVAMFLALFVWLRVFKKEQRSGVGYLLFILTWCGSTFMSYYAAELKQYSLEVFVSGIFAAFLISQKSFILEQKTKIGLIAIYFLIPFSVLFSYTAYFLLLLPFVNVALGIRENRRNILYAGIYSFACLVAVALSYFLDVRFVKDTSGMWGYWHDYFVLTDSAGKFFESSFEGLRNIFSRWILETKLLRHIMTCFMPLALYVVIIDGVKDIIRNKGAFFTLRSITFMILCEMYIAGILKLYPFTGARITLFIAPFIFYSIIKGIELFKNKINWIYYTLVSFYSVLLCCTSIYILIGYIKLYNKG